MKGRCGQSRPPPLGQQKKRDSAQRLRAGTRTNHVEGPTADVAASTTSAGGGAAAELPPEASAQSARHPDAPAPAHPRTRATTHKWRKRGLGRLSRPPSSAISRGWPGGGGPKSGGRAARTYLAKLARMAWIWAKCGGMQIRAPSPGVQFRKMFPSGPTSRDFGPLPGDPPTGFH